MLFGGDPDKGTNTKLVSISLGFSQQPLLLLKMCQRRVGKRMGGREGERERIIHLAFHIALASCMQACWDAWLPFLAEPCPKCDVC